MKSAVEGRDTECSYITFCYNHAIPAIKRTGYLEWEEYFMMAALVASQRSKDPSCQVALSCFLMIFLPGWCRHSKQA